MTLRIYVDSLEVYTVLAWEADVPIPIAGDRLSWRDKDGKGSDWVIVTKRSFSAVADKKGKYETLVCLYATTREPLNIVVTPGLSNVYEGLAT